MILDEAGYFFGLIASNVRCRTWPL